MNLGKYPRYAVVAFCGFLLFFIGFLAFLLLPSFPFSTVFALLVIVLLTVALSYGNRTPLGGFFLGVFTSASALLGFFLMISVWYTVEYSTKFWYRVPIGTEQVLSEQMVEFLSIGPGILSAVLAIASIGLFFGLLGYVFEHISLKVSVTQPRVFRDYWSNVHLLGKSDKREYSDLDRKLSSWSIRKKGWRRTLVEKITEPQHDLAFVPHRTKKSSLEYGRGDLFDLSSGRMIGKDLIVPSDLASKCRPFVLKVAEISSSPKGVRRLALERLISRFLEWLIPSRAIWAFYLLLSAFLVSSVYLKYLEPARVEISIPYSEVGAAVFAIIASAGLLFFVWRWRKVSEELFERRPDERVLILVVYMILALLYGFFYAVIVTPPVVHMSPPFVPGSWVKSFLMWSGGLLPLTLLLGFGYIWIHRECEVVNTYFYDNSSHTSGSPRTSPFKESHEEPFWLKEEKVKAYWVFRFMYFWRYEVAKIPHSDWERVEVWVDAEKGTTRWIVSDYHYRELWYKVKGDLPILYVTFFINFHTPVPVVNLAEIESILQVFNQTTRNLTKTVVTGKASEIVQYLQAHLETLSKLWTDLHPMDWIRDYGLPSIAAKFCSQLPWTYWRYPHGLEKGERYLESSAARLEDQPMLKPGVS